MAQQPGDGSPGQVGQVQQPVDRNAYDQQQAQAPQESKGQVEGHDQGQQDAAAPGAQVQADQGQLGVQPAARVQAGAGAPDAPTNSQQLQVPEARVVPAVPDQHQAPQGQEGALQPPQGHEGAPQGKEGAPQGQKGALQPPQGQEGVLQPPPQDGAAVANEVNNDEGLIRAGPAGDHIDVDENPDEGGADYKDARQDGDAADAADDNAADADDDDAKAAIDDGRNPEDQYRDDHDGAVPDDQVGHTAAGGAGDPDNVLDNDPDAAGAGFDDDNNDYGGDNEDGNDLDPDNDDNNNANDLARDDPHQEDNVNHDGEINQNDNNVVDDDVWKPR